MTRIKRSVAGRKKRKKIMAMAKGYRGTRQRHFRNAREAVRRGLRYAFEHRKDRKGDFRKLWIARINARVRQMGLNYSRLIRGLKLSDTLLNRKMLSELALSDEKAFASIVEKAKSALGENV